MTVKLKDISYVVFFVLWTLSVGAQNVASHMESLHSIDHVKDRLDSMLQITKEQLHFIPDSGRVAGEILLKASQKEGDIEYEGLAHHYIGVAYAWQGKYDIALDYYKHSLEIFIYQNNYKWLSLVYTSIGGVYYDQNNYTQTMEYWQKAKQFAIKSNDDKRKEICNNNLAVLYQALGEYSKAKNLFKDNLEISKSNNWSNSKALAYQNLSSIFILENQLDSALNLAYKAYSIYQVQGNYRFVGDVLKILSQIHFLKEQPEEGFDLLRLGIQKLKKSGDDYNVNRAYQILGKRFLDFSVLDSALHYCNLSYEFGQTSASLGLIKNSCSCLSDTYQKKGNFEKAFWFQKKLIQVKDSILNKEIRDDVIRKEFKYEYRLKAEKDSVDQVRKDEIQSIKHENELKTQRFWTYFGMGLAVLAVTLVVYIYRNLQRKKKDHEAITLSKEIIEEKNREITDSINYAQRIQTAMLPSKDRFKSLFPQSFVMYRPKDIVAGDFYWVHELHDTRYVAVADCTGHGVPGAMMSVVCNSALNRSIREFNCTTPDEILNQSRQLIIEELSNGRVGEMNTIKDGMDISLVAFQGNKLFFSGAYNSICIIRTGSFADEELKAGRLLENHNYNLLEFRGDKQPVGIGVKHIPFSCIAFQLEKNDQLFMFTDGYPDQFGRNTANELWNENVEKPQGKKFKSKNLKKLLLQIASLSPEEQKDRLEEVFDKWKSDIEQLDDVCIVGLKI